ncbi:hypothetical protein AWH56_024540 [Anaerobacillus isosaccharinicus]|uniref:Uncharacterized protein n=1 Tax=Anaerobacillus isosaccharinicus TaxID=1532552 RepID=A0A1S2MD90_9BACI|nr:hypothetical protein [Anaerobacillus isosaccharinicus]MBA5585926.1 hypothetical protein [Anaerobacillus isosaccharinicus]QOY35786.1 hypothetical protein AWH56_024540 [Anaerobacillus isosaccharinicus]
MLWLHIFILVGLLSVFIPSMFFLTLSLKLKNSFRSLLVTTVSFLFTVAPAFYIYSGLQLYIITGSVLFISIIAGFASYVFFEKHLRTINIETGLQA